MTLSKRARDRLTGISLPADIHRAMAADPWSANNPDGYVNLGTAENRLLFDLLEPKLVGPRKVTAEDTQYQPLAGSDSFRGELAVYLSRQRGVPVKADELVLLAGSTAALDAVAFAVCDPGDGIVMPAPYFPGLDTAFGDRAGARLIAAPTSPADGFRLTGEVIERAIANVAEPIRAVALLSPHNPLGHVYDRATLTAVAEVVRDHELDLISDEVYAGSVFDGEFVSVAALDVLPPDRVHVVWGFSKDFGMSGFRVGALSSGDPDVRAMAAHLAMVASPSSDTQAVLREMLADGTFLDAFERERVRRLADAYAATTKALDEHRIGYVEAAAGLYVWIDLRPHLEYPTFESERLLWRRLFETGRVIISPGGLFHTPEPGWFRLCFASAADGVRTGIERIASALDGDQ